MFVRTSWLTALVKSSISLLTFSLVVLAISERAVLKSPTITIDYLFSPFNFAHFCFLYFDNLLLSVIIVFLVMLKEKKQSSSH